MTERDPNFVARHLNLSLIEEPQVPMPFYWAARLARGVWRWRIPLVIALTLLAAAIGYVPLIAVMYATAGTLFLLGAGGPRQDSGAQVEPKKSVPPPPRPSVYDDRLPHEGLTPCQHTTVIPVEATYGTELNPVVEIVAGMCVACRKQLPAPAAVAQQHPFARANAPEHVRALIDENDRMLLDAAPGNVVTREQAERFRANLTEANRLIAGQDGGTVEVRAWGMADPIRVDPE